MEDVKGSIEPGKVADFCVIDGDILNIDPHRIINLKVLMTIVGGRIVFETNY
jgi:predicted amidohydrolase YtcJ